MENNYFNQLNSINVNEYLEKKGNLSYLSWAPCWRIVKQNFPEANYIIYENAQGWNYFTDGRTCWVKTGVIINDIEHIEELPVLNHIQKPLPFAEINSFDINKTIQRSLTKACARHGLGLYVYSGEDLPESDKPLLYTDYLNLCNKFDKTKVDYYLNQLLEYRKMNKNIIMNDYEILLKKIHKHIDNE